jgi:YafQ family addiction module toxin component
MYSIENSPKIDLIFKKLAKKNPRQLEIIAKKLPDIVKNPHRFKPLGNIMKGFRRVHFGHYVLTFSIDEKNKIVMLEDYDHHDNIYIK